MGFFFFLALIALLFSVGRLLCCFSVGNFRKGLGCLGWVGGSREARGMGSRGG